MIVLVIEGKIYQFTLFVIIDYHILSVYELYTEYGCSDIYQSQ